MSNETPAEVLADERKKLELQCPYGYSAEEKNVVRILDRLERALAAGKVARIPAGWVIERAEDDCISITPNLPGHSLPHGVTGDSDDPCEKILYYLADALLSDTPADPAKASEPEYDRSLIADMLESANGLRYESYSRDAMIEQARLLRAADNADAAKVRTVRGSGSAPDFYVCDAFIARLKEDGGCVDAILWKEPQAGCVGVYATPPASAPEVTVTEAMALRLMQYLWRFHSILIEDVEVAKAAIDEALTENAALQEGKSHDQ